MTANVGPESLPPGLAGALQEGPPAEPRPSASVVLVRGTQPWEVLLMRRPRETDFAAGAHVFPGGSVHAEDRDFPDELRAAAVRELFEEVGILLGHTARGPARARDVVAVRHALANGASWQDALRGAHVTPAFDRLTLYTRWITPELVRRRFDTAFFLARVPLEQDVEPNPAEVADWTWVEPSRAIADQSFVLVYATRHILAGLAEEADASALVRRYRRRRRIPVVRPRIVQTEDGLTITH